MIDFPDGQKRGHFANGVYYADLGDAESQQRRIMERNNHDHARLAAGIVRQIGGSSFGAPEELQDFACERAVELRGRALTRDEHARLVWAARDLWFAHAPTTRYAITERGTAALHAEGV